MSSGQRIYQGNHQAVRWKELSIESALTFGILGSILRAQVHMRVAVQTAVGSSDVRKTSAYVKATRTDWTCASCLNQPLHLPHHGSLSYKLGAPGE